MTTTQQNNCLIAEFMGYKIQTDPTERFFGRYREPKTSIWIETNELHFDTSWDWLMPVIEKIEDIQDRDLTSGVHYFDVEIRQSVVSIHGTDIEVSEYGSKLKNAYEAVVAFINWHNYLQNK